MGAKQPDEGNLGGELKSFCEKLRINTIRYTHFIQDEGISEWLNLTRTDDGVDGRPGRSLGAPHSACPLVNGSGSVVVY